MTEKEIQEGVASHRQEPTAEDLQSKTKPATGALGPDNPKAYEKIDLSKVKRKPKKLGAFNRLLKREDLEPPEEAETAEDEMILVAEDVVEKKEENTEDLEESYQYTKHGLSGGIYHTPDEHKAWHKFALSRGHTYLGTSEPRLNPHRTTIHHYVSQTGDRIRVHVRPHGLFAKKK